MSMRAPRVQGVGHGRGGDMAGRAGGGGRRTRAGRGRAATEAGTGGTPDPPTADWPAGAAFAAGAVAVLTTHQAVLWALHRAGWAPWPAYSLAPTRPLGVPAVASAAFWGGAWWAGLARLLPPDAAPGAAYARAALLGAVVPNAAGALLVALGRGHPLGDAPRLPAALSAAAVNGLWAVTAAALLRRPRPAAPSAGARSGSSAA
jgi:hypothetical protein